MATYLSPGVNTTEIDLTTIVPQVATTFGAFAGVFSWGPVGERILCSSVSDLTGFFAPPNANNAESFFTAANFLSYNSGGLYVSRAANTSNGATVAYNAVANASSIANVALNVAKNSNDFYAKANSNSFDANTLFLAKYVGALGNSLKISSVDTPAAFCSSLNANGMATSDLLSVAATFSVNTGSSTLQIAVLPVSTGTAADANTYLTRLMGNTTQGDYLVLGNTSIGTQYVKIANYVSPANSAVTNSTAVGIIQANTTGAYINIALASPYRNATNFVANTTVNSTVQRYWEFYNVTGTAPTTLSYQTKFGNTSVVDGMHVVVVDQDGLFTGVPGTVLETYKNLSRATDSLDYNQSTNYFKNVINQTSKYIWAVNDRTTSLSNTALNLVNATDVTPLSLSFVSGSDSASEANVALADLANAWNLFASKEDVDITFLIAGKNNPVGSPLLVNWLIDNIASTRLDCVVFHSPDDSVAYNNVGNEGPATLAWRNQLHDTSYAFMDTGYKYQYDTYNNLYRWVPLCGDIAGLFARTATSRAPWYSFAGLNRGLIKNIVKLRWNPNQAARDLLYPNGVNPVVSFPNIGPVLYGDRTMLSKPSAFDSAPIRFTFITLEKAISLMAKYNLFEINDVFTRNQFIATVTPYLRDIVAQRGINSFQVVCDGSNNTGPRIDAGQFWGDIYIIPNHSINFIQLNFIAVGTDVSFSTVIGTY